MIALKLRVMSGIFMPLIIIRRKCVLKLVDILNLNKKISATSSNCGKFLFLLLLIISHNVINKKINSQRWINKLSTVQRLNVDGLLEDSNSLRYSLVLSNMSKRQGINDGWSK